MVILALAALAAVLPYPLKGRDLDLCIDNQSRLDKMTLQRFQRELADILAASNRPAEFVPCGDRTVRVTLRSKPPSEEGSALGAARREGGRVLPELELFVDTIARLVDTRLPAVLGRAMARVATHEIAHYLYQHGEHTGQGLMMERLSAAHLLASDRRIFRLPLLRADAAELPLQRSLPR